MNAENNENHAAIVASIGNRYAVWMDAIRRQDIEGVLDLYADDAVYMAQAKPRFVGIQAIRSAWEGHFQRQDFGALYIPTLTVAHAGDIVYDVGSYIVSFTRDGGKVEVRGKYVVIWKNVAGCWKVAVDMDNTD